MKNRMEQPTIRLKKIYEHDMDLLIAEEFVSDRGFSDLFVDEVGFERGYTVEGVCHSAMDSDGESDLVFMLSYPDCKRAVFVEDKIDADTMLRQSQRYLERAEKGKLRGEYDEYRVLLVAPEEYLQQHRDDPNAAYSYRISYERLLAYFSEKQTLRSAFKTAVIQFAIQEKKNGYRVIEDVAVTAFWKNLRNYCRLNYPQLTMVGKDEPKGSAAAWPEFRTDLPGVKVIYKSQQGYVDLEFSRFGDKTNTLKQMLDNQWTVCRTGASAVVRLSDEKWKTDFHRSFDEQKIKIDAVLHAVEILCTLSAGLDGSIFD